VNAELFPGQGGRFRIWDHPKKKHRYVVGVDVATGKVKDRTKTALAALGSYDSKKPDYSAAMVVEVESGQHVASWHGHLDATQFYPIVASIGFLYNTALIVPEINGPGRTVVEGLTIMLRYPKVYRAKRWNRADPKNPVVEEFGWKTTEETRPNLIARISELLHKGALFTRDLDLILEMQRMQIDPNGKPTAIGKDKDDRVFALGMALQGRREMLLGSVDTDLGGDDLPSEDREVWNYIDQQKTRRAADRDLGKHRGSRARRRLRSLSRPVRLRPL